MITTIAKLTAAEGKADEMRAALETMVAAVDANEPGVSVYSLHTVADEPNVFYFYEQYDDFVINYNEKFAKPGKKIMAALTEADLISKPQFDDKIEWTWFYLWHHEGRRARHGASMMAPDYAHWHDGPVPTSQTSAPDIADPQPWQYDPDTNKHWNPNPGHRHWHDGTPPPANLRADPDILNPQPWQYDPDTNKHWDPGHSHWHSGPSPVSPTTAPDDDNS